MAALTLDTFNEILFGALKDSSPKGRLELLENEIQMCAMLLTGKMAELCDELVEKGYESELFSEINGIKENTETLMKQADELRKEIEQMKA